MNAPNCSKCDAVMEEGFILDRGHYNSLKQLVWIEGKLDVSRWTGGLKTKDRLAFTVITFRCPNCGLLESYASEEG